MTFKRRTRAGIEPRKDPAALRRVGTLFLTLLLAGSFPARGQTRPFPDLERAVRALSAGKGPLRERGQAWLAEHLAPPLLGPFLESLEKRPDPEVRVRAVKVLSERLDLFPALARRYLDHPTAFLLQALSAQVRRGLPPPPEKLDAFRPLPQVTVRLAPLPRTPAQVGGLLERNLSFPLPLLVWPGFSGRAWAPLLSWGGPVRNILLSREELPWLAGGRVLLRRSCILLVPPGAHPPKDPASLVTALLGMLARGDSLAREAALALGQVPFLPLGDFLLQESGARKGPRGLPFLWGLASFVVRSGFGPQGGDLAWKRLVGALGRFQGEGLAWAASALASLGPGKGPGWGKDLEKAWKELGLRERWRALLASSKTPFPSLGPFLEKCLAQGAATPREAALLLRSSAHLSLHPSRKDVSRAVRLAGPGTGSFGARLLAPLEKKDGLWALKALSGTDPGLAELGACALGETPGWGGRVLVETLPDARNPLRLKALLLGLRTARDRGETGLGPALLKIWKTASGPGRLPAAIGVGLLLDEGFFLGSGPDLEEKCPVATWRVKDAFQDSFPDLTGFLEAAAGREGSPFRFLAARALGRLHGLHQDFNVGKYLSWAPTREGGKALLLLLREWVQVYPSGGPLLAAMISRGRLKFGATWAAQWKALPAGSPPPWCGLDLDLEDPLTWALKFSGK